MERSKFFTDFLKDRPASDDYLIIAGGDLASTGDAPDRSDCDDIWIWRNRLMMEEEQSLGHRGLEPLILRALVRKLVEKNLLSTEDVRTLLFDAARGLDIVGGTLTPQATRDIVNEDLLRPFLEDEKRSHFD